MDEIINTLSEIIKTAKEIDRILQNGFEIHPNSPIHEKLMRVLKTSPVDTSVCDDQTVTISVCRSNSNCAFNDNGCCKQQDGICEDKETIQN